MAEDFLQCFATGKDQQIKFAIALIVEYHPSQGPFLPNYFENLSAVSGDFFSFPYSDKHQCSTPSHPCCLAKPINCSCF